MALSRLERWAPVSGIAFVVLFVVGFALIDFPDSDAPAQEIASFYDDSGDRAELISGSYLLALAGLSFLWFLGSLRTRLLAAEAPPGRLSAISFAAGVVFVAMLMAAAACFMTVAANVTFGDEDLVNPEVARLLPVLGYPLLLIGGMFAAAAMIGAASVLTMRTGALPRWIGWFGFAAAVALLFAALFLPILALLLWVLFVSVTLLRARPATITQ